MDMRQIFLRV